MTDDRHVVDRLADAIHETVGRRIGAEENFFDAGLNSRTLVALHGRVTQGLPRPFPVTLLFARPNLLALRRHLDGAGLVGPAAQRPATTAGAQQRRDIAAARRRLRSSGFDGGADGD
ncbi:acyl carrier protein [Kutzneria kofuensis]|uniref:acyl carrier protein n=1 Tax=Kutzneria kofuensis TaxID=103725 RepID=UPI0031EF52C4